MKDISKEHSVEILTHMCEMIGLSYDAVKFIRPDWFQLHTWTPEEENQFIDWLAEFLVKHKYVKIKRRARHEAEKVNMQYGWKTTLAIAKKKLHKGQLVTTDDVTLPIEGEIIKNDTKTKN